MRSSSIIVEYIVEISDMSDMSLTFSPRRNFPPKISRHIRNFESVLTLSLTHDILPMCRESIQYVGLVRFFAADIFLNTYALTFLTPGQNVDLEMVVHLNTFRQFSPMRSLINTWALE
jgi:hypothetical protein